MTSEAGIGQTGKEQWRMVDEGWGRRAVEFAALCEPSNVREYVAMHQRLGVGTGDRLLDIACGSGLALELAGIRGARCAGLDASPRLIAVAKDRNPDADLRVGDMNALPWEDDSFSVVTSFRGIWGTTPQAVEETLRVLLPGGRVGLTVWGHIKVSPGAWAMAPFTLATEEKVQNQADMVALGRPGAGETLLSEIGFTEVERIEVPFVFEFADPEAYARGLAATGPAFEAIQTVGEEAFIEAAVEVARQQVRDGLPIRAQIALVGYLATKPTRPLARSTADRAAEVQSVSFLAPPPPTHEVQRLFDADLNGVGYVMNMSLLWAHLPSALDRLAGLLSEATEAGSLSTAQRSVLITAAASELGDSYCSLAWGTKLAAATSPEVAAAVIQGDPSGLEGIDQALARWARLVATEPNAVTAEDVQAMRDAGFDDSQIFAITAFVAFRLAFSTVNDALGALPDHELDASTPEQVRHAITFGRPPATSDVENRTGKPDAVR
ncbi:MAG TPA: methyltransferase domain-containing protein [Acidimicrobiales bacterium]|nr:methyltransferase domain-containing protein [Acidimicrobiales bacterium]